MKPSRSRSSPPRPPTRRPTPSRSQRPRPRARSGTTIPSLSIASTDAVKLEGNGGTTPFTFTVTRSGDLTGTTTVNYAVTGVGADPADADDFGGAMPGGLVTFAPGVTTRSITVFVTGDTSIEPEETFNVTLSGPDPSTNQVIGIPATGTIRNDDEALTIAANTVTMWEGNPGHVRPHAVPLHRLAHAGKLPR